MAGRPIDSETLAAVVAGCPKNMLRPKAFFVSWHGVMTLAYEGFSQCVLDLKASLEAPFPSMPTENEGSKWPKTTLGALNEGRVLTLEELEQLNALCARHNDWFTTTQPMRLTIEALNYVHYDCRSLERISTDETMALRQNTPPEYEPPDVHRHAVDSVLNQFTRENLANYIDKVQEDGHREHHYRSDNRGASLIYQLPSESQLIDRINRFTTDIDVLLPGYYAWFHPQSYHVTIRSLQEE
ncbi:hypothetical protein DSCA_08520 [Desulfosarcina alkanivorans]|jgi:hypothetical protein|uniref:Uncharacterized protein n=1 Tax=Desulfosarcina alkanivorans TaxID=571177 RepID=A0A5K7YBY7_9BACT|nr:hypothetical protein [Desulfosarcina alkanivorans]BBO66922.1 hypothetical protein DSCA_08520 [Desulfosarcina alkanivorans]